VQARACRAPSARAAKHARQRNSTGEAPAAPERVLQCLARVRARARATRARGTCTARLCPAHHVELTSSKKCTTGSVTFCSCLRLRTQASRRVRARTRSLASLQPWCPRTHQRGGSQVRTKRAAGVGGRGSSSRRAWAAPRRLGARSCTPAARWRARATHSRTHTLYRPE